MKKLLLTIVALLAIGSGAFFLTSSSQKPESTNVQQANQESAPKQTNIQFSEDKKSVKYVGVEGITALATLESLTTVTSKDSSYGKFVTGINGIIADESVEFWAFYVNGKMANEGAGSYKTKEGDTIEWKLEKIQ